MDKLRVVSWNCQYGLEYKNSTGKKSDAIETLRRSKADILILQELTENDFKSLEHSSEQSDWYGDDKDAYKYEPLGVAVFARDGFAIERLYKGEIPFRYILPYKISRLSDGESLTLFAAWIKPVDGNYEKPLYNAIQHYKSQQLLSNRSIIIGDFNTFATGYNGRLVELENSLQGLYNCAKDFKANPTFFSYRYGSGTDDFCFATSDLSSSLFEIGPKSEWIDIRLSDHCPIFVDFVL
jgi:endonuclease/exonuclease/phosphatase family metal-dependent hydrolase